MNANCECAGFRTHATEATENRCRGILGKQQLYYCTKLLLIPLGIESHRIDSRGCNRSSTSTLSRFSFAFYLLITDNYQVDDDVFPHFLWQSRSSVSVNAAFNAVANIFIQY